MPGGSDNYNLPYKMCRSLCYASLQVFALHSMPADWPANGTTWADVPSLLPHAPGAAVSRVAENFIRCRARASLAPLHR